MADVPVSPRGDGSPPWDKSATVISGPSAESSSEAAAAGDATPRLAESDEAPELELDDDLRKAILALLDPCDRPGVLGRIGDYEVCSVIGCGGMGVVLKAFDARLHRVVAMKFPSPQVPLSATFRRRFQREARSAAAISHPNVVTIHAVGEHAGIPFLVMEYIEGCTLRDRIRRGPPLEPLDLVRIGAQIASGLEAAHRQGVVHRDIKPSNIMLENGIERCRIADFGLARVIVERSGLTSTGAVIGTPSFMAPEQVTGEPIDERTDLFSLGCVLYAMATGSSPFKGRDTIDIIRRVSDFSPPPLHEAAPRMPEALSQIVSRLLEKDPSRRFQSAREAAEALLALQTHLRSGSLSDTLPGFVLPVDRRRARRRRRLLGGLAAALGFALLVAVWPGPSGVDQPHVPPVVEPPAPATVLTVSRRGGADFETLGAALAQSTRGAVIRVLDDSVYHEALVLDSAARHRDVTIEAPRNAVLQPPAQHKGGVDLAGIPGVTLRGLRLVLDPSQHGLRISGPCEGLTIEDVEVVQPDTSSNAAVVLYGGAQGTPERPIVFRRMRVQCGQIGLAVVSDDGQTVRWLRVEECRFHGPDSMTGVHVTLEGLIEHVTLTRNLFSVGWAGVALSLEELRSLAEIDVIENTFHDLHHWLLVEGSALPQGPIAIRSNLVLNTSGFDISDNVLAHAADHWLAENVWELNPLNDVREVRRAAVPVSEVPLLSRDPRDPDFLRPRGPLNSPELNSLPRNSPVPPRAGALDPQRGGAAEDHKPSNQKRGP